MSKFMPELSIVNSLRNSASFSYNITTFITGNAYKSVKVNLKCIFNYHILNYFNQEAQQSAHLQSCGVNKLRATDSSTSPDIC